MKKIFLILAAGVFILPSCTNGDPPEGPIKKKNILAIDSLGIDTVIYKEGTGQWIEK